MEFTLTFVGLFFWIVYLMLPLLLMLVSTVVILGLVVSKIENWTWQDGLYWSFITATTVGYGDIRPLKKIGRILSILIALIGLMFTGMIIAVTVKSASLAIEKHHDIATIEKIKLRLD